MAALPYSNFNTNKKKQVEEMFDTISSKYDFLNHLLSLNIDKIWRRNAIKRLKGKNITSILDIATGTGDFAIQATKIESSLITGIDISEGMLEIAKNKIEKRKLSSRIKLSKGDSENLEFKTKSFDAVIVAFGVRNFENLKTGLDEMYRVLKNNGTCVILEFSKPENGIVKQIYYFYFNRILPFIGRVVSKEKRAYAYLPESVHEFPSGKNFIKILESSGFKNCMLKKQTLGIATIYVKYK